MDIINLNWSSLYPSDGDILKRLAAQYERSLGPILNMQRSSAKALEDFLTKCWFSDSVVVLGTWTYTGGLAVLSKTKELCTKQDIKEDQTTVWAADLTSGMAIANYVNGTKNNTTQFISEEKIPFDTIKTPSWYGFFDDFDGSKNPHIGVTNLQYSGVGGVIHEPTKDEQIAACGYLPYHLHQAIYIAEKSKWTYEIVINSTSFEIHRISLEDKPVVMNHAIDSGRYTPAIGFSKRQLHEKGFYDAMGDYHHCERIHWGIAQTISGLRDNRQVVMNMSWSHQADYLALLLSEAGSKVYGQNGNPMSSESYAMLAINPSFSGDSNHLVESWSKVMNDYKWWAPSVKMNRLSPES